MKTEIVYIENPASDLYYVRFSIQGHWVVLQNIHLMPRWTLELEKKLDEFAVEGSHPDFRVFLSAEPSDSIPIGILGILCEWYLGFPTASHDITLVVILYVSQSALSS